MKNKRSLAISSALVLSMLVTACGGGAGTQQPETSTPATPATPATEPAKKEVVNLKFWGGVPEESGPKAVVDAWNAANPDVQVEYIRYVNDEAGNLKLDTALLAGQDVDLFVNYNVGFLEKRVKAGAAVDLGTLEGYSIDEKIGPMAANWKIDDKHYAMPTTTGPNFVWLNKTALDEAGLEVPKEWTLQKLQEYAAALTKEGRYGFAAFDWFLPMPMDTIIHDNWVKDGASNFSHPSVKINLETYYDMMHKDKSMPTLGEQLASKLDVSGMFLKGETAMLAGGGWIFRSANNLKDFPREFVIALAPLPSIQGFESEFAVEGGLGDAITINAKSENVDAAWRFLQWYADEGIVHMIPGGRIPASSAIEPAEAVNTMIKGVEHLYNMESIENTLFADRKEYQMKLDTKVRDARKSVIEKYYLNDIGIDEALKLLVEEHNKLINQ